MMDSNYDRTMKELYSYLMESMENEVLVYKDMVDILVKKQKSIISGSAAELRVHVEKEQKIVQKANVKAETRNANVLAIAKANNLEQDNLRLSLVIELSPDQFKINLSNLRLRLQAVINEINRINKENRYLINNSINHVRGMVQLFLRVGDDQVGMYDNQGMYNTKEDLNKVLDYKI